MAYLLYEYTPKYCESITIFYSISYYGSPCVWEEPPGHPDVEIESIHVNGEPAPADLEELLLEQHDKRWENEIIEKMLREKDE